MGGRIGLMGLLVMATGCNGCPQPTLEDTRANPSLAPSALDFGTVDVTQRTTREFTIRNDGDRDFDELTFELSPETDPAFTLGELPQSVPSGQETRTVRVSVLPLVATTFAGVVKVRGRVAGDGAPDPLFQEFEVPLSALAVDNGLPDIQVEPAMVTFGRVGLSDVVRKTVTIRNVGVRDLIVQGVVLEAPPDGPFRCATCAAAQNSTLTPTSSVSFEVAFNPGALQDYAAELVVTSTDPDEREVRVPLSGAGQEAPVACITLLDDVTMLRPEGTVRMDGACSTTPNQGAYIQQYQWELVYRTVGSTTTLESVVPDNNGPRGVVLTVDCPDPALVGADPCSTRIDSVADLAGTYEVALTVVDSTGIRSAPTTVRYRATPTEALHIQLVWDHPSGDLDLHFMRGSGPLFNHLTDCYFSNRFPVWFGDAATDPRNPRLDVDDQGGFGPENVNVIAPEPGRYRVAVHYWNKKTDGDPAALATLRIFVKGQLAVEQNQFFSRDQEMWLVGDLDWPQDPDAQPVFNPLADVSPYPRPF
jgi:hypothetical protein